MAFVVRGHVETVLRQSEIAADRNRALAGTDARSGAIVLTSRVSVEMVQKAAMAGCAVLVAASAPTVLALRLADEAGITLAAFARAGAFELYSHPERIETGASDVA